MHELTCYKCKKMIPWSALDGIMRRDTCPHCGTDSHACKNCRHYDTSAHWECREHITEAVKDKEKGNYCDFFQPRQGEASAAQGGQVRPKSSAWSAAEALFKKKS